MMVPLTDILGYKMLVNPVHVAVILDERPMYAVRVVTVLLGYGRGNDL